MARAAGLDVCDQVEMARNGAAWGAGIIGLAAAGIAPYAIANMASGWGLLEALTAVPTLVLARRTWMLQRGLTELRGIDDPSVTDGDDEMAHLRELVRSLDNRAAVRVGRRALSAADQGYAQRRRILERRSHVAALVADVDPHLSHEALAADLDACDRELVDIDVQIQTLIEAVAHLADSADQSRAATVASIRDASDAVNALASAIDELGPQPN